MFELSNDLQKLGESVIDKFEEFEHLKQENGGPSIVFQYSDRKKQVGCKTVFADTMRVSEKVRPAAGYVDFIITFYRPSTEPMTDDQMEILMRHELKHVGWDGLEKKSWVIPHDVEDFSEIINDYGTNWWFTAT